MIERGVMLPTLSENELLIGALTGARKKILSDARRAKGKESQRPEHFVEHVSWDQEIESTLAEIGVARWRHEYWTGSDLMGGPDVGDNYEVRWTQYTDGHLLLYPENDRDSYFYGVFGHSPKQRLVGWLQGAEGMLDKYLRTPDDDEFPWAKARGWWIPQDDIHEIG